MGKEDIVKQLSRECSSQGIDITKTNLSKLYYIFMEIIKNEINEIGEMRLHGIGTLSAAVSQEKQCRNPQNGGIMTVPKKTRVRFKASRALLSLLNEKEKATAS